MASRKGFEVISLKFIFNRLGKPDWSKEDFVREELNKYLKMYASNTSLKYCCALLEDGKLVVDVDFSKEIGFVTVIYILAQMFHNKLNIEYREIRKIVTVSVGILC